ncbi:bifunctional purine biosynthetic protein ADE1 [Colletotrichum liriopes]|uniref:phosphoribosylamine--glycine ligase n=1 Tax=Colletotrichum liriopes TaxID=708192 RepID=A0AA37LTK8_9PEZI|nr:bifunctional purine biosynthetic protein ADE1 [Colletotrichum liriopes]
MATKHRKLRILLIGKGGREHALAWKLTRSQFVEHVYVAPGNAGTEVLPKASNCQEIAECDYPGLVQLAQNLYINLVVVGPDDAVVGGLGDHFRDNGIPCFAPSKRAAIIEGSKGYAKDFMCRRKIPTADYETFDTNDYEKAKMYLKKLDCRVVIKVDGLAAGKGVILPETPEEAEKALEEIILKGKFGKAGETVVIEEYLEGYEISVLTFTDGTSILSLPPGQDHKRAHDGNKGLNTGGMGVYTPVPSVSAAHMAEIEETIIRPTIRGLELDCPRVLEYNARFGDPETQSMILLLPDEALPELLLACVENRLADVTLDASSEFACNITVAAGGYPELYRKGAIIQMNPPPEGTERVDGELRTAGGRVFSVAATGKTLEEAVSAAYKGAGMIRFEGMFYRKDIAASSLNLVPGRGRG